MNSTEFSLLVCSRRSTVRPHKRMCKYIFIQYLPPFHSPLTPLFVEIGQEEIYSEVLPAVRAVIEGSKLCIFAYGQTGSGKTHTMAGPVGDVEQTGVSVRALERYVYVCVCMWVGESPSALLPPSLPRALTPPSLPPLAYLKCHSYWTKM